MLEYIKATVWGGHAVPDALQSWPDGMRVFMDPEPPALAYERIHARLPPDDWPIPTWSWVASFGTYRNGCGCPDDPVNWPDGWKVDMEARPNDPPPFDPRTQQEDEGELIVMSDEDIARWEADRKAQREFEKSRFFETAEKMRRMWE